MSIADLFAEYAEALEQTFADDNWTRLEKYFTEDASYVTKGQHASRREGREEVPSALKANVSIFIFDQRCNSRELTTIDAPHIAGQTLVRAWRCRFTLAGAPDLVITGRERAVYCGKAIALLEEEIGADSAESMNAWLR